MTKNLWLIWKNFNRSRYKVGVLSRSEEKDESSYSFRYSFDFETARKEGFIGFPGFDISEKTYTSNTLFPNIVSRLPNRDRPDYLEILNSHDLTQDSTDWEILEATKGRLFTDSFEFVPEFNKNHITFNVAGVRHAEGFNDVKDALQQNDELQLEFEPNNEYDSNAIIVKYEGKKIGYVPKYYTKELKELLDENKKYSAKIKRLNIEAAIPDDKVLIEVKLLIEG